MLCPLIPTAPSPPAVTVPFVIPSYVLNNRLMPVRVQGSDRSGLAATLTPPLVEVKSLEEGSDVEALRDLRVSLSRAWGCSPSLECHNLMHNYLLQPVYVYLLAAFCGETTDRTPKCSSQFTCT